LTISKRDVQDILTKVLDSEKFDKPRDRAIEWLGDLLKHHLIQVTSNDQIEFCHQLIQEYYAAERLLKLLTSPPTPLLLGEGSNIIVPPFPFREGGLGGLGLSDETLKREYLNYLKWTEPLALMLELVEDEAQAVRVVRLALEVDLGLGARLAGAVKREFQAQTVSLIDRLEIPALLKSCLWENGLMSSMRPKAVVATIPKADEETIRDLLNLLSTHYEEKIPSEVSKYFSVALMLSKAEIPALLEALKDKDCMVRRPAGIELEKIGSSELLPCLSKILLENATSNKNDVTVIKDVIDVISAIQERYGYYNYTLIQANISSSQPVFTCIMHILHLSDLHFGTLDQANLWSSQLAEDLRNDLDIPQLDALILSGDIANYSTPDEYNAAQQFLNKLRQQFPLTPEQIILVPGNHDINWEQAENAYRIERRKNYKGELREGCYIDRGDIIEIRDEEGYKQRFANFSNFYQAIKGEPYPLDYEQQGILHHLTEQNLLILGLNSAWQLDHHYKTRANIHPIALSNALDQISRDRTTYQNCLKIAVWHHPIHSTGEDRITDAAFLDRLAVAGFRLFLHGHVHEAKTSNYRYDMTKDGRHLDQICAGTFGAPTKELVTGTPWQYNLLKFEGNKLTVRTRCRRKENGTWEADSIWRQGKGKGSTDFYAIAL